MPGTAIEIKRFTNSAFGFPRGLPRRIKPVALACIHITGNRRTSEMDEDVPASGARAEWSFANRANSNGPSAHLYVARDGSAIEAINPTRFAAWSNGDVTEPDLDNPGIARAVKFRDKGFNTNEAYWEEIECVGAGVFPLTDAQIETCARRIARRSQLSGLPIDRTTVHGHWQINGVNRQNCPAPRDTHEERLDTIIRRARVIAAGASGVTAARTPSGLPFGAKKTQRGTYEVIVDVARQRSSPTLAADNIVGRLRRGDLFQVGLTTTRGEAVGTSTLWHGNADGTVWMHRSVIAPQR
jgi:hypothetical protein